MQLNWDFIMEYLPYFYHRDDVLWSDILQRFLDNEDVIDEDMNLINKYYNGDKDKVAKDLHELELQFMQESLSNMTQE